MLPEKEKKATETAVNLGHPISPFDKQGNYFVRLFAGDVSLAVTYWIWGGLVSAIFAGVAAYIEVNYAAIITKPYGAATVQSIYWALLAYSIFIWVAIWRSAGKYKGHGWGVVARVMVVIGVLSVVLHRELTRQLH